MIHDFQGMGYSLDVHRQFTTGDPEYNKFIEWQYKHLIEQGLVVQGEFPILWCENCQNAAGEDDILDADVNKVEVQEFGNLWGLLATRPVVSESTYEILSFTAEFFIALIVFTLTEHFLDEYRQRKKAKETPRISESQQGEVNPQPNMQRVNAASDKVA